MTKREKELAEALSRLIQACNARDTGALPSAPDWMSERGCSLYSEAILEAQKVLKKVKT